MLKTTLHTLRKAGTTFACNLFSPDVWTIALTLLSVLMTASYVGTAVNPRLDLFSLFTQTDHSDVVAQNDWQSFIWLWTDSSFSLKALALALACYAFAWPAERLFPRLGSWIRGTIKAATKFLVLRARTNASVIGLTLLAVLMTASYVCTKINPVWDGLSLFTQTDHSGALAANVWQRLFWSWADSPFSLKVLGLALACVAFGWVAGRLFPKLGDYIRARLHPVGTFIRNFGRTDVEPSQLTAWLLGISLFLVLIGIYVDASYVRHLANPDDKLFPSLTQIYNAAIQVATVPDRLGVTWLWTDLFATGKRFLLSMAFISTGVFLGLLMGLFPYIRALSNNFVIALDKIVAFSLLPLLMVLFGIDEGFRIGLAVIAVFPTIVLSAYSETIAYPEELKTKAKTLGAGHWDLAFRVVLPGIMPKMLDLLRLNFKADALMIIAAEMIVASEGLGYRINAVRRYMAMDVVIVYVVVITALLFLLDISVTRFIKWRYPWFNKD